MKHNCIIKAIAPSKGGWFSGNSIKVKGIEYVLLKNLTAVQKNNFKAGDEILSIRIAPDVPPFSFNYEDAGGDSKNEARKFFADVVKHHQQVYTEGFKNPNSGTAVLFEFEDLAMNSQRNYQMEGLTLAAKTKAWNFSYRKKIDAYYFYGENPIISSEDGLVLMDNKQLTIRLCGDNVGLVMRRTAFGTTGMTYLEHFVKEYKEEDENYILKTAILKSFILKDGDGTILKRKGSAIQFGDEIIGSNVDEALSWLNNNAERKKYLLKMVAQSDVVDADKVDESLNTEDISDIESTLENKATEQQIRDEAKLFMIPNHWNGLIENLKPQIEQARPIWKEVENMGLQSKIASMNKPNLDKVKALVESEKRRLLEMA